MKVYIYQIVTAMCTVARMIIILSIGGAEILGLFTMILSTIMITTVLIQIYNNQGIQIKLMEMSSNEKQQILNSLTIIGWIYSLFVVIIIISFGRYFTLLNNISEIKMWSLAISLSTIVSFITSVYDIKSLIEGKLELFYFSTTIGAIIGTIAAFLFLYLGISKYIIFLPLLASISTWLFYYLFYRIKYKSKLFDYEKGLNIMGVWQLIRETWQINMIPLTTVALDFLVRSVFLTTVGLVTLGYYQTIVSIEAMTGNIFQGPFFKKILLSHTINGGKDKFSIKKTIIGTLLISVVPVAGLGILIKINDMLHLSDKFKIIYGPLLLVLTIRVIWGIWGGLGQILLVKKHFLFVSIVEVLNKIFIALFLIMFLFFFKFGLLSYVYSTLLVGSFLLVLIGLLLKDKIENVKIY